MAYTNSPLICYTRLSPNNSGLRNQPISKITIHHMAGNLSIESCGAGFADPKRQASSNYGIGSDGRIGLYVEEKNRAWTSGSSWNDNRAVTIEVANDESGGNWHVSDRALAACIDLCVDICKRNGIAKLAYTGDTSGSLTMHCMYAATACPGPYLKSKFNYIADEVNRRLEALNKKEEESVAEVRWKTLDDVPSGYKAMVQNYIDAGALRGTNTGVLDLTQDMVRCMEIMRRYFEDDPKKIISIIAKDSGSIASLLKANAKLIIQLVVDNIESVVSSAIEFIHSKTMSK